MDGQDLASTLHARTQIVHDAIKDVVHDAGCRTHTSKRQERIEAQLEQVSREVTDMVKRMKHSLE
jgi:hypothetical protein